MDLIMTFWAVCVIFKKGGIFLLGRGIWEEESSLNVFWKIKGKNIFKNQKLPNDLKIFFGM